MKYLIATIVDRGIGIPYKIRKAFPHESLGFEDGDCISYAMKESISSTKENGRGKGSVNIKKPVILSKLTCDDLLLIVSNKSIYNFSYKDKVEVEETNSLINSIQGTLIEWRLYY